MHYFNFCPLLVIFIIIRDILYTAEHAISAEFENIVYIFLVSYWIA